MRSGGTCATVFTYLALPARDPLPSVGLTLGWGYDITFIDPVGLVGHVLLFSRTWRFRLVILAPFHLLA